MRIMSPRWLGYTASLAHAVAQQSKDPNTKVGSVITDEDLRVVSTGYNGFPRCVADEPARYLNKETKYRLIVHAEANAILTAQRTLRGCVITTTKFPCSECTKLIIQAGIDAVHCPEPSTEGKWAEDAFWSRLMMREAVVDIIPMRIL